MRLGGPRQREGGGRAPSESLFHFFLSVLLHVPPRQRTELVQFLGRRTPGLQSKALRMLSDIIIVPSRALRSSWLQFEIAFWGSLVGRGH